MENLQLAYEVARRSQQTQGYRQSTDNAKLSIPSYRPGAQVLVHRPCTESDGPSYMCVLVLTRLWLSPNNFFAIAVIVCPPVHIVATMLLCGVFRTGGVGAIFTCALPRISAYVVCGGLSG